jgi:hypothetical protein
LPQASLTTNVNTFSGNRIKVLFGGVPVGLIQSVRWADDYGLEDASGIGDIHVIEHVPAKAVHTLNVSNMCLFVGNLRDQGIATLNGAQAMLGLVLDIVAYSLDSGLPLRAAKSCSYASGSIAVEAHRIVMQEGVFKALNMTGSNL